MNQICNNCHWGYMMPSQTWQYWHKCPICNYSVLDLSLLHKKHHADAINNPLALTLQSIHQSVGQSSKQESESHL